MRKPLHILFNVICLSVACFFGILWQVAQHRAPDGWILLGLLSLVFIAPFLFTLMHLAGFRNVKAPAIGSNALAMVLIIVMVVLSGPRAGIEVKLLFLTFAVTLAWNFFALMHGVANAGSPGSAGQPDHFPQ